MHMSMDDTNTQVPSTEGTEETQEAPVTPAPAAEPAAPAETPASNETAAA